MVAKMPANRVVMTFRSGDFNADQKLGYVVVVRDKDEKEIAEQGNVAPRRPLLVFLQTDGQKFALAGRNDAVVHAVDEGGQCDPFLDGEEGIVVKGAFFTVQNAVRAVSTELIT
jgi:hypothetical protein